MDAIKEAMIREEDTGEINPALDPYRERPFTRCDGCDGHECDTGCAYPVMQFGKGAPGPLTPMGMARELVEKWHVEHFGLRIDAWKLELLASRIAELMVANTLEAVRGFEDYNGKHQRAVMEIDRLRNALAEIRDHWACQYDHPRKRGDMYSGPYGIGVTDGHRAAASIAQTAIGDRNADAQ